MYEKKQSYNKNDVIVLILKLLLAVAAVAAAVVAGIKIYEKIQAKRMCSLCDCCDDDYFDEDDFCDCCCESDEPEETVADVTENEVFPKED